MLNWAHTHGVMLRLIEPGKPNQNGNVGRGRHSQEATTREGSKRA